MQTMTFDKTKWKLVPVEPTPEMIDATYHGQPLADIWHDMVAASPTPPQAEQAAQDEWRCVVPPCKCDSSNFNRCCFSYPAAPEAAKPATLSNFIRSDDSTRGPIVARVVDAAVEMQREVLAKPETERADLLRKIAKRLGREIDYQNVFSDMELLKEAAALLSADSKDAGEPVAWLCPSQPPWYYSPLTHWGAEPPPPLTTEEAMERGWFPVTKQEKAAARPQAADAQPLTDEKRGFMVLEHLGPAALTGGKMSVYDAFMLGIDATEKEHGITGKDNAS